MGVYPFMFASKKDFEPIVEEMVKVRPLSSEFCSYVERRYLTYTCIVARHEGTLRLGCLRLSLRAARGEARRQGRGGREGWRDRARFGAVSVSPHISLA